MWFAMEKVRARAACEAAGVPTRIRTGLTAAPEDLELLHPSSEVLAELASLEEYENGMRDLSAMPYAVVCNVLKECRRLNRRVRACRRISCCGS